MNAVSTDEPPPVSHEAHRRAISRHFAGRVSPREESAMRAHLPGCGSCRAFYERHVLLAGLDPAVPSGQQRIAAGLGFAPRGRAPWPSRWTAALLVPVAAVAVVAVSRHALRGERRPDGSEVASPTPTPSPSPRGAAAASASPWFWAYRIDHAAPPRLADSSMLPGDELAFAYANPGGLPYLMIFGRDEHGHLYWFHPAWKDGQPAPSAIPATAGPGPHELPEAIGHAYDGRRLDLVAAFGSTPIDVGTIEEIARGAADADDMIARLAARSLIVRHRMLDVTP